MRSTLLLFLSVFLFQPAFAKSPDFPLRQKYPEVKPIEAKDLYDQFNKVVVVDVRSKYEFSIIHVKESRNIPLASKNFVNAIKKVRALRPNMPIVFYCNGITCAKSYKASVKVQENNIDNVFTFDLGIFEWTKKYPNHSFLLGENPADKNKLLTKKQLQAHMLSYAEFKKKAAEGGVVVDVRDSFQRKVLILEEYSVKNIPMGKVNRFIRENSKAGKTLLIFDAVGKQVRWLQYFIEKSKIKDYYFLKNGVIGAK